MAQRLSLLLVMFTAGAVLAACGAEGATSSGATTTSTTSTDTGGSGGTGGGTGATGTGTTGGTGGTGGAAECGDGTVAASEGCDDDNTDAGDGCDDACEVEEGFTCAGAPSDCFTTCGDGIAAGAEACDDGNTGAGDGCDDACVVEAGFMCTGAPSVCTTTCGDSVIASTEACDDGNTAAADGCDDACAVEAGFMCTGEPSTCVTTCGDGVIAGAEACDDQNVAAGDGCDAACAVEAGFVCVQQPSTCDPVCGDGIIAGAEECDDANEIGGDGCSDACAVENGFVCALEPSVCDSVCGDGIIAGSEGCDDSDAASNDGCSGQCAVENGYACIGEPSVCATVCGDGIIVAAETCDDGDAVAGDGCGAACAVENGYTCMGAPSVCTTTCGDGVIAGAEACDDAGAAAGDGCSAMCAVENGYTCMGEPSACVTICGDGVVAGAEECDDGNQVSGDGCSSMCTPNTGETCADPLVMGQAVQMGGQYTWTIAASAVGGGDGPFTCDPNGIGPDVVVQYVKTSATLANGGQLLHVKADTPTSTATGNFLDVVVQGGACGAGGVPHKCLWYKDNWDVYLDVPAGTYHIWAAKNATGAFPEVTILAEEIAPAAAEGEGCFAPYTSASSIYTPPGGAGQPHTFAVPASINSFDMGVTWGEPQSISCDNHATYGDIHGVDAVIQYDKVSPTSVLKIDVQNLDPVIGQSDLDLEVLNVCDSSSPSKVSRHCRANSDTLSITAPSPAGPVYLWVSAEATGEEMNGATVQVTEIFPGVGESWPTAEPVLGSGPIAPTSAQRLDAPSCFPAAGNIHWYSYTLVNDAFSISANGAGYVGVYDEGGQERACVANATLAPFTHIGDPGDTFYFAVQSPTVITSVAIQDVVYNGVQGDVTDMEFTFPVASVSEFGMAVSGSEIFLGDTARVTSFPKVIGATGVEHAAADGITATHLGYDIVFANGMLFSVDSTATTNVSRLFRIYDGATWGPTTWDLTPTYPSTSPTHGIATDGVGLFMTTRRTTVSANFYSINPSMPATPVLLGTSTSVWNIVGAAIDSQYFYVASNGSAGEGVYRVNRANVAAAAVKIATIDTDTLCNNIEISSFVSPQYLYVRDANADTHAVIDPGGANPVHIGAISTLGGGADYAMTYDKADGSLYIFETETDAAGRIVRLQ